MRSTTKAAPPTTKAAPTTTTTSRQTWHWLMWSIAKGALTTTITRQTWRWRCRRSCSGLGFSAVRGRDRRWCFDCVGGDFPRPRGRLRSRVVHRSPWARRMASLGRDLNPRAGRRGERRAAPERRVAENRRIEVRICLRIRERRGCEDDIKSEKERKKVRKKRK